jgi:hypothetical protein
MNDNRLGGLALILGALSGIITLTFHPAGGAHHVTPKQFEILIAVIIGVHALAICGLPVSFGGALALTRQIDSPMRLALFGLIIYGFGLVAVMAAATMSGLVMPDMLRQIVSKSATADQLHPMMNFTHSLNQAFARVGAIAFSATIFLWSLAAMRARTLPIALAVYGLVSSGAIVIGIFLGYLDLELAGFRVITLLQSLWFAVAGIVLWRTKSSSEAGYISTALPRGELA